MDKIIFWGATGQAKVLRECLEGSRFQIVALFDNNPQVLSCFPDVPIYYGKNGFQQWFTEHNSSEDIYFSVAIGGNNGESRLEIHQYLQGFGLKPMTIRHRTAFIAANAVIGAGSQILAQSAVCVETTIGKGCIINTGASVDHECQLSDGVHVAPGAHLAGCVEVGRCVMIGTGASILPHIKIGHNSVVGAGAVVTRDVPPNVTVVGNPARLISKV
jgi:sugar O-acyltransferase (sialic acid O-acetyltransferase NeuD family)